MDLLAVCIGAVSLCAGFFFAGRSVVLAEARRVVAAAESKAYETGRILAQTNGSMVQERRWVARAYHYPGLRQLAVPRDRLVNDILRKLDDANARDLADALWVLSGSNDSRPYLTASGDE